MPSLSPMVPLVAFVPTGQAAKVSAYRPEHKMKSSTGARLGDRRRPRDRVMVLARVRTSGNGSTSRLRGELDKIDVAASPSAGDLVRLPADQEGEDRRYEIDDERNEKQVGTAEAAVRWTRTRGRSPLC